VDQLICPFFIVNLKTRHMETVVNPKKTEFESILKNFHGTKQYHRHRLPNGMFLLLTDGCNFVREHSGEGASWLFDLVLSWQLKLRKIRFQVWKLQKQTNGTWYIECSDGNHNFIVGQEIGFSDFPLDSFEFWVVDGVALLPSEY
jgi:hypothetical protein